MSKQRTTFKVDRPDTKRLRKHAIKCAQLFLKAVCDKADSFQLIRYQRVKLPDNQVRVELTFIIK